MNIWLFTVNFINSEPTKNLISSLENQLNNKSLKIFIADNNYSEKSKNSLLKIKKSSSLDIELHFFRKNLYYWPALNKLIKIKKNSNLKKPDWIIVCNNDVTFIKKDFLIKLKNYVKDDCIIGPKIINEKNENLNPFLKIPLTKSNINFWNIYFSSYFLSRIINLILKLKTFFIKKSNTIKKMEVYAAHGSMIIFSYNFFEDGGYLDNNFKMYGEEITNAEISKNIGYKIIYDPEFEIFHKSHASTNLIDSRELYKLAKKSHYYILKKYLKK